MTVVLLVLGVLVVLAVGLITRALVTRRRSRGVPHLGRPVMDYVPDVVPSRHFGSQRDR